MKQILIKGNSGQSTLLVGERITNIEQYLSGKKVFVITDENINKYYGNLISRFPLIVLEPGEQTKTLQTVETVVGRLLDMGADRHSFLLGIGGGVVCDITGFVASVFMRGIAFGFVSSSLLAQVDASVGGKNGVNLAKAKNIIGTITQPDFVICDVEMLKTLPEKEIKNGWGEIIKHALIADKSLFDELVLLEKQDIFTIDTGFYEKLVFKNIRIKAQFVNNDEHETGNRKKLNFGHTLGHAIEQLTDLSHGEAIIYGMLFALWWSETQKMIPETEYHTIVSLLNSFKTTTDLNISPETLTETIRKDKKRNSETIDFVFLTGIGNAVIKKVSFSALEDAVNTYFYR